MVSETPRLLGSLVILCLQHVPGTRLKFQNELVTVTHVIEWIHLAMVLKTCLSPCDILVDEDVF